LQVRILLFKLGALGDLLMTTPLARQLRRQYPTAQIDYLTGRSFKRILEGNPNLDRVLPFPEEIFYKRDPLGFGGLVRRIRRERYDTIFVLDRHWAFALTAFLFGIGRRIGFDRMGREGILLTDRVRFEEVRHEVHYYLDLLAALANPDFEDVSMEFYPHPADGEFADRFFSGNGLDGKRVVCLAPGGGVNPGQEMAAKRWPADRYAELARLLLDGGFSVVLVGGEMDRPFGDRIRSLVEIPSGIGATLGGSAALMRKAFAVVASDGGPMHLAASVNDRVISIFGPTDPRRLAPLNGYRYLWKPGDCGPCHDIYGRVPVCNTSPTCMEAISAEEAMEAVSDIAANRACGGR
jgi:lipopolysaccharide heptosyltransferase II